jgi:hypothetical protein
LRLLDYLVHHEALRSLLVTTVHRRRGRAAAGVLRGLSASGGTSSSTSEPKPRSSVVPGTADARTGQQPRRPRNPLFAVETIRSLLESGALQLGAAARSGLTPLPDSVQAAIRGRWRVWT